MILKSPTIEPGDIITMPDYLVTGQPSSSFKSPSCQRNGAGRRQALVLRITFGAADLWPYPASQPVCWVQNVDDGVIWGATIDWIYSMMEFA